MSETRVTSLALFGSYSCKMFMNVSSEPIWMTRRIYLKPKMHMVKKISRNGNIQIEGNCHSNSVRQKKKEKRIFHFKLH